MRFVDLDDHDRDQTIITPERVLDLEAKVMQDGGSPGARQWNCGGKGVADGYGQPVIFLGPDGTDSLMQISGLFAEVWWLFQTATPLGRLPSPVPQSELNLARGL